MYIISNFYITFKLIRYFTILSSTDWFGIEGLHLITIVYWCADFSLTVPVRGSCQMRDSSTNTSGSLRCPLSRPCSPPGPPRVSNRGWRGAPALVPLREGWDTVNWWAHGTPPSQSHASNRSCPVLFKLLQEKLDDLPSGGTLAIILN